jgi:glycosyltransferase involved in cell wall biosynthesis
MPIALDQGGGTRLKALEALAAGVAIVSTAKGVEGLDLEDGEHVLIGESDEELAQAVLDVWRVDGLRQRLVEAGHTVVRERYGLERVARSVADAVAELN